MTDSPPATSMARPAPRLVRWPLSPCQQGTGKPASRQSRTVSGPCSHLFYRGHVKFHFVIAPLTSPFTARRAALTRPFRGDARRAGRIYSQMRFLSSQQKENQIWNGPWFHPVPTPNPGPGGRPRTQSGGPNHNDIKTSSTALGSYPAQGDEGAS